MDHLRPVRYAITGVAATVMHVAMALFLHGILGLAALKANLGAFTAAWLLSYFGNHAWTFGGTCAHRDSIPRFLAASLMALALNQAMVWFLTGVVGWPLAWALVPVVLIVPTIGYLINQAWVFQHRQNHPGQ